MADDGGEVLGFDALFSFQGRVNRGTFWKVFVLNLAIIGASFFLWGPKLAAADAAAGVDTTTVVLFAAVYIVLLWVGLATQVKRWHDMDKSGWMVLLNIIPVVGFFVFLYLGINPGTQGPNRFGASAQAILF